jgi:hypothetical protein
MDFTGLVIGFSALREGKWFNFDIDKNIFDPLISKI